MAYSVGGESSSSLDTFNSTSEWKYDVFLSFAGKDTRLNFTSHLYDAFIRSGIRCFRDDVDLERGGDIKQDLFQAIQDSLCSVLIISENYANSTWCLEELRKILESRNTLGRRIFPIFYDVDPADLRQQRKSFGEALAKHEEKFRENTEKVQNWKNVLVEIANLSGWDTRNKHEADLIKNIVGDVWTYLSSKLPSYDDNLVGIDSRVGNMMPILEIGLDDKCFVGIWGMGGAGKTTLATVVSEKLSDEFEICCFLGNVRETLQREGLVSLQKRFLSHLKIKDMEIYDDYEGMKKIRKLLCNKKVLLVLDDLDDVNQLKNLAESPNWFGKGSRIIITTRDSQLLTSSRVQRIYEMKTMKKDESLQLFSNKAFYKDHPEEKYLELSQSVVKYAGGLPLALQALGSFLCGKNEAEWRDALDRLKKIPHKNILQVLKISYDGLNEDEKTIFLDIACFFKGWRKTKVIEILDSCDLYTRIGIRALIEKTLLVETKDHKLDMHDLFEDLGRYIIYEESPYDVGKRSRLWEFEHIRQVLESNKGSKAIQAIALKGNQVNQVKIEVHPEAFLKMINIRLLIIDSMVECSPILSRGLKLSSALKVVLWPLCPFEALSLETRLDKLAHIQMDFSIIKQLWNGIQFMEKLKFINMSYAYCLTETPDFSGVPNLEHLDLSNCRSLVKVHPSLGELKKLVELDLDGCKNLEILPRTLETNSLIKLNLVGCKKAAVLPEFGKGMNKLSYLDASGTAINRLSESIGSLTSLRYLNLSHDRTLYPDQLLKPHITGQISGLLNATSLTELYLSGRGLNDGSIPDDFGMLSSLIILDLSDNDFVNLPTGCFSSLFRLLFLSLDDCKRLKSLPRLPPLLSQLHAFGCDSMEPLSETQLRDLAASVDHEQRGRTKYVISDQENHDAPLELKPLEPSTECLPLREFCAIIPGCDIPSWFPNKEYCNPWNEETEEFEIKVNIPSYVRDNKWSAIVVCFPIPSIDENVICWSSKAPKDDDYTCKGNTWAHRFEILNPIENPHLCIMVLELNEKTCWRHVRDDNNSLHIKFSDCGNPFLTNFGKLEILECGWRVICKEEIKRWCNLNQVTHPQFPTHDELKVPRGVLFEFFEPIEENE